MDYHRYIASREWRLRRREVLARSRDFCERCWGAKATQVHHLTYERLGSEQPDDLVALCRPCHEYISAASDSDPLASIPSLADHGGLIAEPLASLIAYSEGAREWAMKEPSALSEGGSAILVCAEETVRDWLSTSMKVYVSQPERRICIAHALTLLGALRQDYGDKIATDCIRLLETIGWVLRNDCATRWTAPLMWLDATEP